MSEIHPASEYIRLFPSEDIPRIIQNVLTCCNELRRLHDSERENSLTERIYKLLLRFREYHIGPIEPQIESVVVDCSNHEAELTGRVDLKFTCGRGVQTYFVIEAKRLFVNYPSGRTAPLVKPYISDGMMRLVKGQYASKMVSGAMLGYVFNTSISEARASLSIAVSKQKKSLKMEAREDLLPSSLPVQPAVDETRHLLPQGEFTIYHILTQV